MEPEPWQTDAAARSSRAGSVSVWTLAGDRFRVESPGPAARHDKAVTAPKREG
jgi:hypothetical protein